MDFKFIFHSIISFFGVFGFIIAPRIHAPFCGAIIFHWLTNNNRCILSDDYDDKNGFTKDLLTLMGLPWPSSELVQSIIPYILLLIPLSISIILVNA
jgi:hypothetical protein